MSKVKVMVFKIDDACENEKEVLTTLLENMELQEIGDVFRELDTDRLLDIARKLHGAMYQIMDSYC